jgi:hypothetical protein
MQALAARGEDAFAPARHGLERMVGFLQARESRTMTHSELERWIEKEGREVMRQLLQGHLDLRGPAEAVETVRDADGGARENQRLHERGLATVFGTATVERFGYRGPGQASLHPVDGELNLPAERYSLEVRRRAAEHAATSSFEETQKALKAHTGTAVPKRQVEELVARAGNAEDFEQFYATRATSEPARGDLLVLTTDGKGVVMRREDLREATKKAAERRRHKLGKRLSKGEKRHRKRMATVAAVYHIAPFVRTPEQVAGGMAPVHAATPGMPRPRPQQKRVWASLERSPAEVIEEAFADGERRDPEHEQQWVALVDGNEEQLRCLHAAARRHRVALTIVLDIIHVVEYLWKAAYVFHAQATPEAEQWVSERLLQILKGRAGYVAGGIARSATRRRMRRPKRKAADDCVRYLHRHKAYLHYDQYLAAGLPIASGVIEGACRHLVRDRMDVTGARWSLKGAEAVLRLRALRSSGDFDAYWRLHQARELERNHLAHYADGRLPRTRNSYLTVVK